MIAIIDYGVGNLFSLKSSFAAIGQEAVVTSDEQMLNRASHVILPGVGAFADAAEKLRQTGMDEAVRRQVQSGKPLMGICLGMQLLFEKSFEYGQHEGLGLLKGEVRPLSEQIPDGLKIPHMGWNALIFPNGYSPLFASVREGDCVYFVHSYAAVHCEDSLIATAEYGAPITAAVAKDNLYGCQFHPEKSGAVGLNILKSFCSVR